MRNLTIVTLLLSAGAVATGAFNERLLGVLYWDGFPVPWFFDLTLIICLLHLRRELVESQENNVPSTE